MKAAVLQLTQLPGVWRGTELDHVVHPSLATGHARLDAELPGGGWPTGTLSEVLHEGVGIGEVTFLARALARASEGDRWIAWINPPHLPYAPALSQSGIPLDRCLVIRPASREDALWAAEQALKSGTCGAVMLWLDAFGTQGKGRLEQHRQQANDYASFRRLQMAAEAGRCMAVHYRSMAVENQSTPAHLRVVLDKQEGQLAIRIPKRRGPPLLQPITIQAGYSRAAIRKEMTARAAAQPALVAAPIASRPRVREGIYLISR